MGIILTSMHANYLTNDCAGAPRSLTWLSSRSFLIKSCVEENKGRSQTGRETRDQGGADRIAPNPASGSRERTDRAGENRFAVLPSFQVFGDCEGRTIAAGWIFLQTFEADCLDVLIDALVDE